MVIDTNSINPAQPGKRNGGADAAVPDKNTGGGAVPAGSGQSPSVRSSDTVELSSQAQNLGRLQVALRELPDVDEARVEQVRQQIADGSYRIDADQIATKILLNDQNF